MIPKFFTNKSSLKKNPFRPHCQQRSLIVRGNTYEILLLLGRFTVAKKKFQAFCQLIWVKVYLIGASGFMKKL